MEPVYYLKQMKTENQSLREEIARLREVQSLGVAIAKQFKTETGMIWGEKIGFYLKACEGTPFSSIDYFAERMPGEQ